MNLNPSKALIALVALISMVVLVGTHAIDQDAGMNVIVAIVFYSIGNGVGAIQNVNVEPIIKRKDPQE